MCMCKRRSGGGGGQAAGGLGLELMGIPKVHVVC